MGDDRSIYYKVYGSKRWWLPPLKVKQERSASKIYLAVFWDNQGVQLSVTMTKETYFNTLLLIGEAIKNKHSG